jgi:DNA-binding response OmpR family regulator
LRLARTDSEHFCIEVVDTGIGIATADLDRLFGAFQQLDSGVTKKYQGTGLGLALTKRIIEAQGGVVSVHSVLGQGSTFGALLPCSVTHIVEERAPRAAVAHLVAARILIIAADPDDQAWLAETLTAAGYAVDIQSQVTQALDLCQEQTYAAITIDLFLVDQLLSEIHLSPCNAQTPIIVVSALAEAGIGIGFAVTDMLNKPLSTAALFAALTRAGINQAPNQTILVVDDDPILCRLLEATLAQEQYATVCATDGATALRLAAEVAPAVIILDLLMPEMDGFAFLQQFRQLPFGKSVPVIVWTSKDLTAEDYAHLRTAAQSVVLKSKAGTASLLEEVRALVAKHHDMFIMPALANAV